MNLKNRLIIGMSTLLIVGSFHTTFAKSFKDLENHEWARKYIEEYSEKNIVSGYEDGTFKPDKFVTREEFAKIVVVAFDLKVDNKDFGFKDVEKDAWYYDYVNTLANMGIVNGISDNEFGVGTNITREDICTILSRVLDKLNNTLDIDESGDISFEDKDDISEYAQKAVSKLNRAGIINGMTEKELKPKEKTTRAQMVKMVYLLKEKSHSEKAEEVNTTSGESKTEKETNEEKNTTQQTSSETKVKKERIRTVTLNGKEYVLDPNEDYPRGTEGKLIIFVEGKKGVKIKEMYTADEMINQSRKVTAVSEGLIKVKSGETEEIIDLDILKKEFKGKVVVLKISKDKKGVNQVNSVSELSSISSMKISKGNRIVIWPRTAEEFDEIETLFVIKT